MHNAHQRSTEQEDHKGLIYHAISSNFHQNVRHILKVGDDQQPAQARLETNAVTSSAPSLSLKLDKATEGATISHTALTPDITEPMHAQRPTDHDEEHHKGLIYQTVLSNFHQNVGHILDRVDKQQAGPQARLEIDAVTSSAPSLLSLKLEKETEEATTISDTASSTPELRSSCSAERLPDGFEPGPLDVICGKGKRVQSHEGCRRFLSIAQRYAPIYGATTARAKKIDLVTSILEEVRETREGESALFVRQDEGVWYKLGEGACREKVGQYLRDILRDKYKSSNYAKNRQRRQKEMEDRGFRVQVLDSSAFGGRYSGGSNSISNND